MGCTHQQHRFLAERLLTATDQEAAEQIGIAPETVCYWKNHHPDFLHAYDHLWDDPLELAKAMALQVEGKVIGTMIEGMNATSTVAVTVEEPPVDPITGKKRKKRYHPVVVPDWKARLQAAKQLADIHGLNVQRHEVNLKGLKIKAYGGFDPSEV